MALASTLVFAGTDTTSLALCRICHLLANDPAAQDRLRAELTAHPIENLDYNDLMALPFLDAVCKETMRLHPPATFRNRRYVAILIR